MTGLSSPFTPTTTSTKRPAATVRRQQQHPLALADSRLGLPRAKLAALLRDAKRFVGAAPQQADTFARTVAPLARKVAGAGSYQPGKLL